MKKFCSHPLFYCLFASLGLAGMGCQWWLLGSANEKGMLPSWHPATVITMVLVALAAVLALVSTPHIRVPAVPSKLQIFGLCAAAAFFAVEAVVLLLDGVWLAGALAVAASAGSVYVLSCRLSKKEEHYWVYGLFALCFVFYLISRYTTWSCEPEMPRFAYQLLGLICMMLAFYQMAAVHAKTGRFLSYHFWRSMALMLSFTAIPSASNPWLFVAAALWLLLSPVSPPRRKHQEADK